MIDFLVNYWWLLVFIIAAISVGGYMIYAFIKRPTSEQLAKVKEWLLYAVTEAEKELGSGTGQIKLRYVYDMFISKFPFLTSIVSFTAFSLLVDEVLDQFKEMMKNNESLQTYVNGVSTNKVE